MRFRTFGWLYVSIASTFLLLLESVTSFVAVVAQRPTSQQLSKKPTWTTTSRIITASSSSGASSSAVVGWIRQQQQQQSATTLLVLAAVQQSSSPTPPPPRRPPRRSLPKKKRRRHNGGGDNASSNSGGGPVDDFPWESAESRPLISSKKIELGEDYWVDEQDMIQYLAHQQRAEQQKKRRRDGPTTAGQITPEKLWTEVLSPYKNNWIGLISVSIVAIAFIFKVRNAPLSPKKQNNTKQNIISHSPGLPFSCRFLLLLLLLSLSSLLVFPRGDQPTYDHQRTN
jgi:hypothetical protein